MNTNTYRLPKLMAGAAVALCVLLGSGVASAQTFIHEGIVYKATGNKLETPKLTGKLKIENGTEPAEYAGDIVIPETIDYNGKTYTVIDLKNAFKGMPITSMVMPNSVTKISLGGFQDCAQLKTVKLSAGLTKIEQNTFTNCVALEEISIPGSILKIDSNQFKGCTGLKKVTIEDGEVPFIFEAGGFSEGAFDNVAEVYIYRQLETPSSMDRRPLRAAKGLKKLVIGGTMTTLYDSFCESASQLENVTFESEVSAIGTSSFAGTALTEVALPATVTTIPSNAFAGIPTLRKVTLGNEVTGIEAMAFRNSGVEEINFPATLTGIGDMAFQGCKLSGKLALPEGLKRIGLQAFASNNFNEVSLPASISSIGNGAFMANPEIWRYELAEGCETYRVNDQGRYIATIDDKTVLAYAPKNKATAFNNPTVQNLAPYALYGCKLVESVDLPACWNYGDYSFAGSGLKKFEVKGAVGRYVASDCAELEELTVVGPEVPLGIAANCPKLAKVNLADKVTVVKSSAFEGCTALKEINLGQILAIIESDAFTNCGLETITVAAAVPAVMPEGVFTEAHAGITAKVPVDFVEAYKAAEGWNQLKIAGDANLAAGSSDMGMPDGLYYAGEDGMLHGVYADGGNVTYDVGGVPHTFQLVEFKNRIYGASAGQKFVYSATGAVDGDGKLFYISKVGGELFQAVVLDNTGNNAYKDPFGLYIYGETLYVNDRNVCIRKIPANAISLPQDYPSWMENNWMAFYGAEWVYGCIKSGFAITQTTADNGEAEPLYWVGMKYNGFGIYRFRESNIGTGANDLAGKRPSEPIFLKQFDPIFSTFAVDSKNGHLYIYIDRAGTTAAKHVKGGLYRLNIADLEANPEAADFNAYNPVLIDGAPVAWEGGGSNEHVGISQLTLDDTGEYLYWCYRAPSTQDVEMVAANKEAGNEFTGGEKFHYSWAEDFDASNPRHQDGIKRIKLGEAAPEVETVVPGVRGYGVVALNYAGSKTPEVSGVNTIEAGKARLVTVAGNAIMANEAATVDIYNAAGLIVARVALEAGESFDTTALSAGVYVGVATAGAESQTFKFVK